VSGVLVTGMHHSGTSMVAAVLAASGWHPGEELVPDDPVTGKRFVEDASLVEMHRRWFGRALRADGSGPRRGLPADGSGRGHPDWGITDAGPLDLSALTGCGEEAAAFVARRGSRAPQWLAKDPRASLVLPVWATVPGLRFVLVYRSPWDTVDSVVRLGHPPFIADPDWVRHAWRTHNLALLAHVRAHRHRCLLVSAERVAADPVAFACLVGGWSGDSPTGLPGDGVDPARLVVRPEGSHLAAVARSVRPDDADLLDALDAAADLRRPAARTAVSRVRPAGAPGPGVQVIIPCRDDGAYIDEAVASVDAAADATDLPVELTIVDDGSTDGRTLNVLSRLEASGRQVLRTPGLGLSAARNRGAAVGRTGAVLPLDSDNRLRPELLAAAPRVLRGDADVVHGPWQRFGLDTSRCDPPPVSWGSMVPENTVDACSVVSRRMLADLGGWDETLPFLEDWDLWMRALQRGARFHRVTDLTFEYLVRPGSLSARAHEQPKAFADVIEHFVSRYGHDARASGAPVEVWEERIEVWRSRADLH